jgi:hypothetical protein
VLPAVGSPVPVSIFGRLPGQATNARESSGTALSPFTHTRPKNDAIGSAD